MCMSQSAKMWPKVGGILKVKTVIPVQKKRVLWGGWWSLLVMWIVTCAHHGDHPASLSYFLSLTLPHRSLSLVVVLTISKAFISSAALLFRRWFSILSVFFLSLFLQCCSSLTLVDSDDGDGHLHFWCWFTQFNPLSVAIGKTSAASLCVCVWGEWEREKRGGGKCCLLNITCDSRDAHWTIRRVSGHLAYPPETMTKRPGPCDVVMWDWLTWEVLLDRESLMRMIGMWSPVWLVLVSLVCLYCIININN